MKRVFLFILLLLISICGISQTVNIKGSVSGNGEPLSSANITVGNETSLSDSKGEFLFMLTHGTYTLTITHTGYKEIEQQIIVEAADQTIDFNMIPVNQMEEVVVVGSRSFTQRSNLNTPVPVDIFSSDVLKQTGQTSLTQMLNFAAPSVNASLQLSNEPITLRGLDPDHVLILVNGIRYHNMAYLNDGRVKGILGKGSVANDLNSIPYAAIEKIEVLRDGASAQYGSDAIAGVVNIILKKSTAKTSFQLHTGEYYKGDGETFVVGVNSGILLKRKKYPSKKQGFLDLSMNMGFRNATNRGGEFKGTVYKIIPATASHTDSVRTIAEDDSIVRSRDFNRNSVSNAGSSKLSSFGILINGGYPVNSTTEIFWTALVNQRKTFFIGSYILPKNITRVNTDLFPDGFQGVPYHNSTDVTINAGIKGQTKKWHWEYTTAYGNNTDPYHSENTNNASQFFTLSKNAPSTFNTGTLIYQQLTNNLNFSKELSIMPNRIKFMNIGFGIEARVENYQIKSGEEAAWKQYDLLNRKVGGVQHGLVFQPGDEVNKMQNVLGTYVDVETELSNHLLIDIATRYEYYSRHEGNIAGKVALRYKMSNAFSLRSSMNCGFREPGLQQRYYNTTTRGLRFDNGQLVPVTNGIFNNTSIVAQAFGISALQPEKSLNVSAGFTAGFLSNMNLTVDAYWIQIKDRIVLSGVFDRRFNNYADSLLRLYNASIDQLQFFANAINTRTRGLDVVINSNWKIKKSDLLVMLAANFNDIHIFGAIKTAGNLKEDSINTNTLFNREEKIKLEKSEPSGKIIFSVNYKTAKTNFMVRNAWFGSTMLAFSNNRPDEHFSPKVLTDFSVTYTPVIWLSLTVGANNVFNVYLTRIKNYVNTGEGISIYSQEAVPFGFNGGYYYLNIGFKF